MPSSSSYHTLPSAVAVLSAAVAGAGIEQAESSELTSLVDALRTAQATVEAGLIRVGLRADELAAEGRGAPARDALLGQGRVRGSTARREARRAALAQRSPELGRALSEGSLGPDHLDCLVRRVGGLDDDHLARLDLGHLLDARGAKLPADTFDAALRRAVQDTARPSALDDEAAACRRDSEIRHWFDRRTGMGHLSGRFDAERYEALVTAIDQHATTLANRTGDDESGSPASKDANLAAAALVDLVCSSGVRRPHLPHVAVVVDEATLRSGRHGESIAETGDGHPLSDQAIARLCCDAVLRRVVLDRHGVPIDVGRHRRTATTAQWAALRSIHSSCAWSGCDAPLSHCQAHHLRYWSHGGPTDLENLVPLCAHHHHLAHEGRWSLELHPDRSLTITRPDGQPHAVTTTPTRRPPPSAIGTAL